jgi:hypothetical protein
MSDGYITNIIILIVSLLCGFFFYLGTIANTNKKTYLIETPSQRIIIEFIRK